VSTLSPPVGSEKISVVQPASYAVAPGRRHFWLRRLHSLAGLVFGGYVVVHLLVNATGFWPKMFQQNVDHIHDLEPMLPLIEITAIFIPLLLHALYGIYITTAGVQFNTMQYNYGGNVRYMLQRVCGIILVLFIGYHVATLHKWGLGGINTLNHVFNGPAAADVFQGYPEFNAQNVAYQTTAAAIRTPSDSAGLNLTVRIFYLLGVWSATFHFANGLWTSAIAWGLTVTAAAQKRFGHFCCAVGIMVTLIGTGAWAAFALVGDPALPEAATMTRATEQHQDFIVVPQARREADRPVLVAPATAAPTR